MSIGHLPKIVTNGLVFLIDPMNNKSFLRKKQNSNILIDPHTWTEGTGGFSGYSANGSDSEQQRVIINDDPWGGSSVVWRTVPDNVSGADGGWDTSYFTIDRNYTYRYSVWVRRHTSGTGGTFYMGLNPAPIRNDTGIAQSNPYFTYPSQSSLEINQWYLVVAHCFYQGYSGSRHPDSGWYKNGVKITDLSYGNCGDQDVRWDVTTTSAQHRTYHYYTTNVASGLEFAYPRIDKCDGSQPTIQELINVGESRPRNIVSSTQVAVSTPGILYNDKYISFEGTAKWIDITGFTLSGNRTVSFWIYPKEATTDWRSIIDSLSGRYIIGTISNKFQLYSESNWRGGPDATLNQWQYISFSTDGTITRWYKNGVFIGSYTGTIPAIGSTTVIGARYAKETAYLNSDLSQFTIHNRALSAEEIQQNFDSTKGRFGL